jgi:hypothetical protein
MAEEHKGKSAAAPMGNSTMNPSKGTHGGNRGGERTREAEQPKKSSQSAGRDPRRGERER